VLNGFADSCSFHCFAETAAEAPVSLGQLRQDEENNKYLSTDCARIWVALPPRPQRHLIPTLLRSLGPLGPWWHPLCQSLGRDVKRRPMAQVGSK
jgi:hypothetical protein